MTTAERIVARGCSVYGCCKPAVSKGFCDTHRKRLERHGSVLQTRPSDWGLRDKHPLRHSWRSLYRAHGGIASGWSDFWDFVKEVGEKPSENHRLSRIDDTKAIGPGNWYWRESLSTSISKESRSEYMRAYTKARREADPWHEFRLSLRRHYGITVDDYLKMHDAQNGVCAICKCGETSVDNKTKKIRRLAVDHCHDSKKIRGLLCSKCNTGLGSLGDNTATLLSAVAYLEKSKC